MDDIAAVLDATGSRRAALIEVASASMLTAIFAATYPERTQALVIYEPRARGSATADYPWSSIPEQTRRYQEAIKNGWGWVRHAREVLAMLAPSRADDEVFVEWLATSQRRSAPPQAALALAIMDYETDVRHVLPAIGAPTLVLNRRASSVGSTARRERSAAPRKSSARCVPWG